MSKFLNRTSRPVHSRVRRRQGRRAPSLKGTALLACAINLIAGCGAGELRTGGPPNSQLSESEIPGDQVGSIDDPSAPPCDQFLRVLDRFGDLETSGDSCVVASVDDGDPVVEVGDADTFIVIAIPAGLKARSSEDILQIEDTVRVPRNLTGPVTLELYDGARLIVVTSFMTEDVRGTLESTVIGYSGLS